MALPDRQPVCGSDGYFKAAAVSHRSMDSGSDLKLPAGGTDLYGFFLYRKPTNFWRILAAELTVALLVNVLLGTFWLSQVYGKAFMVMLPARLIKNVIKAPVGSIILYLVMTVLGRAGVFRMLTNFPPGKKWRMETGKDLRLRTENGQEAQTSPEYSSHGDRQ